MPTYRYFYDEFDEIDLFDAHKGILRIVQEDGSANAVIPVVGLGISDHPFHPGEDLIYLDRAYLVFEGLARSHRTLKRYMDDGQLASEVEDRLDFEAQGEAADTEDFQLEGICHLGDDRFYALRWDIAARRFLLVVPSDVRRSDDPWLLAGPGQNMDLAQALDFLRAVPDDVLVGRTDF